MNKRERQALGEAVGMFGAVMFWTIPVIAVLRLIWAIFK